MGPQRAVEVVSRVPSLLLLPNSLFIWPVETSGSGLFPSSPEQDLDV